MIFVSDLHLGRGDGAEDFSKDAEREFLRFLYAFRKFDVFVLGDLTEMWQANLEEIIATHSEVFKAIQKNNVTIVPGNHDDDSRWMHTYHKVLPYITTLDQTLLLHGHQADPANAGDGRLGKTVTQVIGVLERAGWDMVDEDLSQLWNSITGRIHEYEQWVAKIADGRRCTRAIYGHTHLPRVKIVNGIEIANCATWTRRFDRGYPYIRQYPRGLKLKWWGYND